MSNADEDAEQWVAGLDRRRLFGLCKSTIRFQSGHGALGMTDEDRETYRQAFCAAAEKHVSKALAREQERCARYWAMAEKLALVWANDVPDTHFAYEMALMTSMKIAAKDAAGHAMPEKSLFFDFFDREKFEMAFFSTALKRIEERKSEYDTTR